MIKFVNIKNNTIANISSCIHIKKIWTYTVSTLYNSIILISTSLAGRT